MFRIARFFALFLSLSGFAARAEVQTLPAPEGPVLLTIFGNIAVTNVDETAQFDLEMLQALGETDIVTDTIWTSGSHRFTGVLLETLLAAVGAEGAEVSATAINDYTVEIPRSDATEDGPIIAYAMDGKPMSRRDKGPLWVIYPYASDPKYRTEVIYARSIWQLDRLTLDE
ncbi:molybdopterin-dependent oxidoreductase [Ponticoccus litoralis]|uniref:Molybdopterin-dependent oxidoreductase n=1 Tax=Ponticoccus litoralis TaxID=422297 RepID=A0AAW9SMH8_9RHOB